MTVAICLPVMLMAVAVDRTVVPPLFAATAVGLLLWGGHVGHQAHLSARVTVAWLVVLLLLAAAFIAVAVAVALGLSITVGISTAAVGVLGYRRRWDCGSVRGPGGRARARRRGSRRGSPPWPDGDPAGACTSGIRPCHPGRYRPADIGPACPAQGRLSTPTPGRARRGAASGEPGDGEPRPMRAGSAARGVDILRLVGRGAAMSEELLDEIAAGARRVLDENWLGASTLPSRTPVPAPVELGLGVHRDRPLVVRRGTGPAGAAVAVPRPVGGRARAAHRVQPVGRRGGVLPGAGVLAVVHPLAGRAARRRDLGDHPAAHPRPGRAGDAPPRDGRRTARPRSCASCTRASSPRTATSPIDAAPVGSALPVFMHPWESGLDNSPRGTATWPRWSSRDGAVPPYVRHDLDHANPADRPTNAAYDRFVFLAARYRDSGYDDRRLARRVPFLVAGPLFNAIYLWSTHALAEIAEVIGADPAPHREAAQQIHEALLDRAVGPGHEALQRARRRAQRAGRREHDRVVRAAARPGPARRRSWTRSSRTCLGQLPPGQARRLRRAELRPARRGLRRAAVLARPRLDQHELAAVVGPAAARLEAAAEEVLLSSLRLVARSGFHEYFDPFTGEGFGTGGFGWTAALTLDVIERQDAAERARIAERLAAEGLAPTPTEQLPASDETGLTGAPRDGPARATIDTP